MKVILVYVEGGGATRAEQSELRQGFDAFLRQLKDKASAKRVSLRFVFEGGRTATRDAFMATVKQASVGMVPVLLVDSEEPPPPQREIPPAESDEQKINRLRLDAIDRKTHLTQRQDDQWDLKGVDPEQIHLIGCCLESLLCADPEALAAFYQNGFNSEKLPVRTNLEEEPKESIYKKLANATKDTKKGEYSDSNNAKIQHAKKLLEIISLAKVRKRCPHFDTFVTWLDEEIDGNYKNV